MLGSMEFGCAASGAKVVLVLGHTACGAVKGAIDNVVLGNLTGLLARIKPAIQATNFDGEKSSKNASYVDAVASSKCRSVPCRDPPTQSNSGGPGKERKHQDRRRDVQPCKRNVWSLLANLGCPQASC
jgi:hypothetical protein